MKSPAIPPRDTVIKTAISDGRLPHFGFGRAKYIGENKHGSSTLKSLKSSSQRA